MSLVEISNASFKYPQNKKLTLSDINLNINRGEFIALTGLNGSGKSTLARMLAGFFKPDSGQIKLQDGVLPGIVFQQPKEQIVAAVVERDTAFGPQNLNMTRSEIELRTIECLSVVDLTEKALSGTYELSLGQTQRLAFSGILALFPDMLILDEVTAMLDPAARDELNAFIRQWNERGCTVVHVTHDADEALAAGRVIVLDEGKIIYDGTSDEFKKSGEVYDRIFGDSCLDELASGKNPSAEKNEPALCVKNISFSYRNSPVFSGLNFSLPKGSLVSLTGPSGCGKSTLFECLAGLAEVTEGSIHASSRPALALQESEASLFERYAADDVAFGPRNRNVQGKVLLQRVKKSMELAGLPYSRYANRGTFYLSGGEKRKLSIASLIALDEDILIFDEPTSALDCTSRKTVLKTLRQLADEGKTVLFSTHRIEEEQIADINLKWEDLCRKPEVQETELPALKVHKNAGVIQSLKNTAAAFSAPAKLPHSPVAAFPPVLKLILYTAILTVSIFTGNIMCSAVMLGVSILYSLLARYPLKKPLKALKTLLPVILIFAVLQFIFYPLGEGDKILWEKAVFVITDRKLLFALRMLIRTGSAIFATGTFLYTTREREILDALSIILKPLALIKIPVRYFILVVAVIFRFMPLLLDEFTGIVKTQIVRGAFSNARGLKKAKVIAGVFLPLLFQSFRKAQFLADALTARYFN